MSMEHTPIPWTKNGLSCTGMTGTIFICPTPQNGGVFECTKNAEFIFRACDCHEELLEFVRLCALEGSATAKELLAKAKGVSS